MSKLWWLKLSFLYIDIYLDIKHVFLIYATFDLIYLKKSNLLNKLIYLIENINQLFNKFKENKITYM
jgi:hypothetical protein